VVLKKISVALQWLNHPINQQTAVLLCGDKYFLTLLQNRGDNRLWLRFRKCTNIFTLCVDCVGQTHGRVFRGHV